MTLPKIHLVALLLTLVATSIQARAPVYLYAAGSSGSSSIDSDKDLDWELLRRLLVEGSIPPHITLPVVEERSNGKAAKGKAGGKAGRKTGGKAGGKPKKTAKATSAQSNFSPTFAPTVSLTGTTSTLSPVDDPPLATTSTSLLVDGETSASPMIVTGIASFAGLFVSYILM